jgi:predicted TIM-barrel fold metal-dependent hydrolase
MAREDDEDPGLPIKLGPCSNGEYEPEPLSPVLRETIRRAREACEHNARRTGLTRRDFLLSVCGAATTLFVLDACTREAARVVPYRREPGGRYEVPPEATVEPEAAREVVSGEEFVFDMQGHLLEYDLNPSAPDPDDHAFWSRFPQQSCGEEDPRVCYSIENFMEEMFLKSDTSMVVLSALPIAPTNSPLSASVMEETRQVALGLCRDERVLLHGQALPNVGPLEANLDAMEEAAERYPIAAWKVFTHYPDLWERNDDAWWLDDHEPGVKSVGEAFIRKSVELGIRTICSHKGLSRASRFASPEDVGPAARHHPDVNFVVYHSGFDSRTLEGPYTKDTADLGVNRLIASMKKAGIGPNENVYAELGSTWWYLMRFPDRAAHVLGKLLKYVGEDNVVWGTDCLFYGSPQDQIQALRAFTITDAYQEGYGYPPLTKKIKRKILGLNGARLYGVDPITVPCTFSRKELEEVRKGLRSGNRTYGPKNRTEHRRFEDYHRAFP